MNHNVLDYFWGKKGIDFVNYCLKLLYYIQEYGVVGNFGETLTETEFGNVRSIRKDVFV